MDEMLLHTFDIAAEMAKWENFCSVICSKGSRQTEVSTNISPLLLAHLLGLAEFTFKSVPYVLSLNYNQISNLTHFSDRKMILHDVQCFLFCACLIEKIYLQYVLNKLKMTRHTSQLCSSGRWKWQHSQTLRLDRPGLESWFRQLLCALEELTSILTMGFNWE